MTIHHSGSTYVTVPIVGDDEARAFAALRKAAAARLGGEDGLRSVAINRLDGELVGTFIREWDEAVPDPVPAAEEPVADSA